MANKQAIQDLVFTFADAAKDFEAAKGQSGVLKLMQFQNLIADFSRLIPEIGDIPAEAKDLAYGDYMEIVASLVARLGIKDEHAVGIINAALKLANDIGSIIIPDVSALLNAIKA